MMPSSFALGEHFEHFIKSMVASGRYNNASEVVRDGLRALEEQDLQRRKDEAELDAILAESLDDIANGRVLPAQDVFDELKQKLKNRRGVAAAE